MNKTPPSPSLRTFSSAVLAALLLAHLGAVSAFGQITIIDADTTVTTAVTYDDSFTINNGATLNIVGPDGAVDSTGSAGVANVGATNETDGNGILTISAGGALSNITGRVGYAAGISGEATVTGADSFWQSSNILYIGFNGTGSLTVANGATVSGGINGTSDATRIGYNAGSSGDVLVTGTGSGLTSSGTLTIGWSGTGSLSVVDGATVSGNIVHIGRRSSGSATITGSGSVLAANSGSGIVLAADTSVAGGNGILTLASGGMARSNNGASSIRLSLNAGGTGTLNIGAPSAAAAAAAGIVNASTISTTAGTGTVQFNTTSTAANPFFLTKDGTDTGAAVTISGLSQVVHTAGYSVFGGINTNTGATTVDGGTLIVNGSADSSAHTVNTGATLGGSGSVGSLLLADGAFVSPGQSPGTLSVVNGATLAAGSNMVWEVSDAAGVAGTDWDLLSVGGTLTLEGTSASPITVFLTSLDPTFAPGLASNFDTSADATFVIASAASITGFDPSAFAIDTSGFANAFDGAWSVALDQNQIVLSYAAGAAETVPILDIAVDSFGDLVISCPSETGFEYQLEVSTTLSGWVDFGVPQDGDGGDLIFTVPGPVNPGDKVFYRVRVTPK